MILDIKKELIEDFILEISGNPKDETLLSKWKVKPEVADLLLTLEEGFPGSSNQRVSWISTNKQTG